MLSDASRTALNKVGDDLGINGVALTLITVEVMSRKILAEPVEIDCSDFSVGWMVTLRA